MIAGLMGFTVLLAPMAWLVIRLGRVWNDARTLLVLVILMFVAISVSCDFSLAESLAGLTATRNHQFPGRFCFCLRRQRGAPLGAGHPAADPVPRPLLPVSGPVLSLPCRDQPSDDPQRQPLVALGLVWFFTGGGHRRLALLPAVRRGPGYGRPNGTPWSWPWLPWTLFVVLAMAVGIRACSMLLSFHTVAGGDSIFRPYFLVPFLWAVGLVLLEVGLAVRSRGTQGRPWPCPSCCWPWRPCRQTKSLPSTGDGRASRKPAPCRGVADLDLASFDLDALRAYRRAETTGNAFRRPAAYRSLTDAHIADIFVRVDRYGHPPGV